MTPEKQIKALAELDGITNARYDWINANDSFKNWHGLRSGVEFCILPNYLTSYDTIIPMIQKQPVELQKYIVRLMLGYGEEGTIFTSEQIVESLISATPAQLCAALLRATGKWEE